MEMGLRCDSVSIYEVSGVKGEIKSLSRFFFFFF